MVHLLTLLGFLNRRILNLAYYLTQTSVIANRDIFKKYLDCLQKKLLPQSESSLVVRPVKKHIVFSLENIT